MWVLLLLFMTNDGRVIAYDQGHYTQWSECRDLGKATVAELDGNYSFTCVEWKR